MNEVVEEKLLMQKLEDFMVRAVDAEAKNNLVEAERFFRLALYCEGRCRLNAADAKEYAQQVSPLYIAAVLQG